MCHSLLRVVMAALTSVISRGDHPSPTTGPHFKSSYVPNMSVIRDVMVIGMSYLPSPGMETGVVAEAREEKTANIPMTVMILVNCMLINGSLFGVEWLKEGGCWNR